MKAVLDVGVFVVTVLMMVTVGMELQARHFREVPRMKWLLCSLFALPLLVLPALAYVLIRILALPPYLSAGILLIAACPVGDIANFYILLARGNSAVTFILDALTCLLSAATMWLIFKFYHLLPAISFDFAIPTAALVSRVTLMAALPVVAGMLLRRLVPRFVEKSVKIFQNLSFAGIGLLLTYIFVKQRAQLEQQWLETAMAATIFMVLAMSCGFGFGAIMRLNAADRFTSGIIFAVRNVGLAMAISISLLNRVEYAVFAGVYFITEVPVMLAAVALYRYVRRKSAPAASNVRAAGPAA